MDLESLKIAIKRLNAQVERLQWIVSRGLAAPDGGPSATYYDRLREPVQDRQSPDE